MTLLEVCVDSVGDLRKAVAGGARRIELCARLDVGGLTPTRGLMELAQAEMKLPICAMVRPRGGDFTYDEAELASMRADLAWLKERKVLEPNHLLSRSSTVFATTTMTDRNRRRANQTHPTMSKKRPPPRLLLAEKTIERSNYSKAEGQAGDDPTQTITIPMKPPNPSTITCWTTWLIYRDHEGVPGPTSNISLPGCGHVRRTWY